MREIIEKFKFGTQIDALEEANLTFQIIEQFSTIDLHPDKVSNLAMGYVFEELIRKFNEASNENPGEHFTPREIIRLMVNLLFAGDLDILKKQRIIKTVYDPACGSGGMLTEAKEWILESVNKTAQIEMFGQEVNPETFAVAKSDFLIKGENAENIKFGSTLAHDKLFGQKFDYMLSNPPYGKEWKKEEKEIRKEAEMPEAEKAKSAAGLLRMIGWKQLSRSRINFSTTPAFTLISGFSRIARKPTTKEISNLSMLWSFTKKCARVWAISEIISPMSRLKKLPRPYWTAKSPGLCKYTPTNFLAIVKSRLNARLN